MRTEEERCAEAKKFQRIDDAFHQGDLDALRAAVDDPATVPNGRMPDGIGPCLVYAIYHSPLAFIRTLLQLPNPSSCMAEQGAGGPLANCTRRTGEYLVGFRDWTSASSAVTPSERVPIANTLLQRR